MDSDIAFKNKLTNNGAYTQKEKLQEHYKLLVGKKLKTISSSHSGIYHMSINTNNKAQNDVQSSVTGNKHLLATNYKTIKSYAMNGVKDGEAAIYYHMSHPINSRPPMATAL